jgi:hypothetical protein
VSVRKITPEMFQLNLEAIMVRNKHCLEGPSANLTSFKKESACYRFT